MMVNLFNEPEQKIELRTFDRSGGEEACSSIRQKQRFIVNGEIGFREIRQTVMVTKCNTQEGDECGFGSFGVPTACVQQESEHRLVALEVSESGEPQLVVDKFMFPSCCSCIIL